MLLKKIVRKSKNHNINNDSLLIKSANEFLKDYEQAYVLFWNAPWAEDQKELGAVKALEAMGKKYFGISQEAFNFINYKVENLNKRQIKPID